MRKLFSKFAFAATLGLALIFIFGCFDNDDDDDTVGSSSSIKGSSSSGKSSSSQIVFECNNSLLSGEHGYFVDNRDNQTYKCVKIGEQIWMAQNLNYKASGSKCYGEDEIYGQCENNYIPQYSAAEIQAYCDKYGRLYDWKTAKSACPSGWHLSSDEEWDVLITTVDDGEGVNVNAGIKAGTKLKSKSGWNTTVGYIPGTNDYGFSALPGGRGTNYGNMCDFSYFGYQYVGDDGWWWDASANRRIMYNDGTNVGKISRYCDDCLHSVRCVKDD